MILPASYHTGFAPRDGYPAYPELWRGCVGAWAPCLGPTGLTLRDWSGRQNHGTLTNMVPGDDWVVSGGRYALDFDGVNDFVSIASILESTGQLTVTAWARQTASISLAVYAVFASSDAAGAILPFQIESYQGRWGFIWGASPYVRLQQAANLIVNRWQHLALTRSGTTGSWSYWFYVDGIEQISGTTSINPGSAQPMAIGRNGNRAAQFFPGTISDLRIYNRALAANEIRLLANRRSVAYEMQEPRFYSMHEASAFNPAWARNSNVILSPVGAA